MVQGCEFHRRTAEGFLVEFAQGVSLVHIQRGVRDHVSGGMGAQWLTMVLAGRTQLYVEADAKMDTFQGSDGQNRTQLNLLMRKDPIDYRLCVCGIHLTLYEQVTSKLSPAHNPRAKLQAPNRTLTQRKSLSAALANRKANSPLVDRYVAV